MICIEYWAIIEDLEAPSTFNDIDVMEPLKLLVDLYFAVSLQWVRGYAGLEGKKWQDRKARMATTAEKSRI